MNSKLSKMLCTGKKIEALYEIDTAGGGFATLVRRSDGREELYPNCKLETVLDTLAADRGKTLSRLRLLRGKKTGRCRGHIDFYEICLSLILMPVRYRQAFNSNHGVMAYLNVSRIINVEKGSSGSVITFMSGQQIRVRESASTVRSKLVAGRELMYDKCFARAEELRFMRITLRRLQKLTSSVEAGL